MIGMGLKAVYTTPDEQSAEFALKLFDKKWRKKYPKIIVSWRQNWTELSTFFKCL
jgi:transposase-like protein